MRVRYVGLWKEHVLAVGNSSSEVLGQGCLWCLRKSKERWDWTGASKGKCVRNWCWQGNDGNIMKGVPSQVSLLSVKCTANSFLRLSFAFCLCFWTILPYRSVQFLHTWSYHLIACLWLQGFHSKNIKHSFLSLVLFSWFHYFIFKFLQNVGYILAYRMK